MALGVRSARSEVARSTPLCVALTAQPATPTDTRAPRAVRPSVSASDRLGEAMSRGACRSGCSTRRYDASASASASTSAPQPFPEPERAVERKGQRAQQQASATDTTSRRAAPPPATDASTGAAPATFRNPRAQSSGAGQSPQPEAAPSRLGSASRGGRVYRWRRLRQGSALRREETALGLSRNRSRSNPGGARAPSAPKTNSHALSGESKNAAGCSLAHHPHARSERQQASSSPPMRRRGAACVPPGRHLPSGTQGAVAAARRCRTALRPTATTCAAQGPPRRA